MKTLLFACMALLLPLFIVAQDDWCTCMETSSYEEVTSYVSQSQNRLLLMSSSRSTTSFEDKSTPEYKEELLPPPKPTPPPTPKAEEIDDSPEVTSTRPVRDSRRAAIKKRKRLFAKRLKKRARARKYRGRCPVF